MSNWVRYEGHGNPVCPICAGDYEEQDKHWAAHAYVYRPDPERGQEYCHCCGLPAPNAE